MLGMEDKELEMRNEREDRYLPVSFVRKRIIRLALCSTLIVLTYTVCPTCSATESANRKIDYELQERCGITSSQWAREHGEVVDYRAYYNKKQNKCVVYATLAPIRSGNTYTSYYMVYDPNANKTLAQYTVRTDPDPKYEDRICIVAGKRVEGVSEEKWNRIVKDLMGE